MKKATVLRSFVALVIKERDQIKDLVDAYLRSPSPEAAHLVVCLRFELCPKQGLTKLDNLYSRIIKEASQTGLKSTVLRLAAECGEVHCRLLQSAHLATLRSGNGWNETFVEHLGVTTKLIDIMEIVEELINE